MPWIQTYDPLGNPWLSTAAAALPIVLLLAALGVFEWRAHRAALLGLAAGLAVSIFVFGMPVRSALTTAVYGAAYGFLPIGWIVLAAVFLYDLTVETGQFEIIRASVGRLSSDRRIQALLVAFSFGAFIEGASGFGTPVAICSALLIGLGFTPLYAAGLSLIANTAPVAFGAIGTPILTLAAVTGIPAKTIGIMAGRQLPFVSVIVPAWLVVTMSGWRGLRGVWPAVVVCGGTFAIVQFAWSNFVGVELVDIAGAAASIGALALFCRVWQPKDRWESAAVAAIGPPAETMVSNQETGAVSPGIGRAWMPWVFLSIAVIIWGLPVTKTALTGPVLAPSWNVPSLHRTVFRDFPVVTARVDAARIADPAYANAHAEAASFLLNWASATGTAILLAAIASALYLRVSVSQFFSIAIMTLRRMRAPLATIMTMMALGFVTRYGGTDATLGLAFTRTGWLYPFFGTLLGWLGVALT
ncbi:MAG TPA: lactate permease LctP family transporter, partial [Vicinamibacterales bacterium]|nr:lactate permease LctP family transporter [Vicinamibacterales bacterium]